MYENLSTALKSKGLSLNAAATILGMPEPTFRAKLNGRSQCGFSIDEAFTIKRNLFPEMDLLDEALQFCSEQGIELYAVNENPDNPFPEEYGIQFGGRKVYADIYIDDKAANVKDVEAAMSGIYQGEQEDGEE